MATKVKYTVISKTEAFSRGLPKWPQMLVTGNAITVDQAKEIIFATDTMLTNPSPYSGGNNRDFNKSVRQKTGYDKLNPEIQYNKPVAELTTEEQEKNRELMHRQWGASDEFVKQAGFLQTEYVTNSWASSSYIFGPYGWCHPDGNISFIDNVGKWPSVEEVAKEWQLIAKRWPFLDLWVTLMSGEGSDDNTVPVVSFRVKDGKIRYYEGTLVPHQTKSLVRNFDVAFHFLNRNEQGLPTGWVDEFAAKVRPIVDELIKKYNL